MEMDVQSYLIGHLGIVAGSFDALNLADVIDRFLPKGRESAIGCYIYRLFIYATWGVAKWAKEVQSLDS